MPTRAEAGSDALTLPVEDWCVRETKLDLTHLAQTESLFALSNGHIGLRGNLDEGEPHAVPGTYVAGFFELRPLPYAEARYGYPESGQTVVNVTNGKLIRLLVDDEPFDVRYGELLSHERRLDLRAGTLRREVVWRSPAGASVRVRSTRLVSLTHRAVAAIAYEVEPVGARIRVIVQSELVANEAPPAVVSSDPRIAAALSRPLAAVERDVEPAGAVLLHRTRRSGLLLGAGMHHVVDAPAAVEVGSEGRDDWARTSVVCELEPGQRLRVVKYLGYGWSAARSEPAVLGQVSAALTGARHDGWDGLLRHQREYLDEFWAVADLEVDGDPEVQQAVRFGLFHMLQAGARAERRPIAAKGLTGPGYDGHAFWDTEGFLLRALTLLEPQVTADVLRWRASTLDLARQRARTLRLEGATFPWRSINGRESSGYWPAGTAAFHVNADIAAAFEDYRQVTGDDALERECGLEVLVETARLWRSLGTRDRDGGWHIDGVTGPDEYTAVVNDNVFTNLMAARNLRTAADACARHPGLAADFGVTPDEIAGWRDAARAIHIPYDQELGVHPQCESFTRLGEWEFDEKEQYPLMLHAPYVQLYPRQVVKQADLVLAMHWCGEYFTPEQMARNLDYYERRTVRDSSLSACTQSVICAEVGHLDLAHEYLREAALMDLRDLHANTGSGLHLACLAGAWTALVEGFGGLRKRGDSPEGEPTLSLAPVLPEAITRLAFRVRWRGTHLCVDVTHGEVRCSLPRQAGARLSLRLYEENVEVRADAPITRPVRRNKASSPPPEQPPGRRPLRRG